MGKTVRWCLLMAVVFFNTVCRKPYDPPTNKQSNHFLAVDGFINTTPNSSTTITLTRSLNLNDSIPHFPELGAEVLIQAESGAIYRLTDTGANGIYISDLQNLDPSQKYQVIVTISSGSKYASDFVTPKVAPLIDSLGWELKDDPVAGVPAVTISISSHDPTNTTTYYRWDYVETWQHESAFKTDWIVRDNGVVDLRGPGESVYDCWSNAPSSNILLGSSIALGSDVISQLPIAKFYKDDPRMDIGYSVLVSQYPLDVESYKYWITIQKNSQSLGGLSDLQPSQIKGNIHGVTNPNDPVFGYISASSVQQKRLFISNDNLPGWKSNPVFYCPLSYTGIGNDLVYHWSDTSESIKSIPANGVMEITKKDCIDCRRQGGVPFKPSFWP